MGELYFTLLCHNNADESGNINGNTHLLSVFLKRSVGLIVNAGPSRYLVQSKALGLNVYIPQDLKPLANISDLALDSIISFNRGANDFTHELLFHSSPPRYFQLPVVKHVSHLGTVP